jgi:hypothetical protein
MADRTEIRSSLEADLNRAIEQSISSSPVNGPVAPASRRAVDQLAQARDGLLKVEELLNQLCDQIVGFPDQGTSSKPPADRPEGLPMFDRVRQDATTLAELAIRMHNRITHAIDRL